jgi:hypothetical protein
MALTMSALRPIGSPRGAAGKAVRRALRRVGATPLLLLGFVAELGWALFGSLVLGLGARPALADGAAAALIWLAGAVALAVAIGVAAWIAAAPPRGQG